MTRKALTYVEIDVDYCSNTYGVLPCEAELGVTGDHKCFNTLRTCQDIANFVNEPVTLRFAIDTAYLPKDIECIPNIVGVSYTPAVLSLGENLGQRATLQVQFKDHKHSDTGPGFDKYWSERPYDPFKQGTMWGKFRARQPYLQGRPIRLIRGFLGQQLSEMETRHFVIDSFDGPTPDGKYTLVAKDPVKLADDDRSQAPRLSDGALVSSISAGATSATLGPSGIGNAQYPSSGWVAIGGEEICAFTRSGDTLTLTRGQLGTTAVAHDAGDRVQLVLRYEAETPATIIHDLLVNYAGVDPSHIDLQTWEDEVSMHLGRLYTRTIAEPTGVNKLVSEIIEQAALVVWWDDVTQKFRLRVLRQIGTDAERFTMDNIVAGSLKVREQPDKRLSQVWTYYGQRNPLERDGPDNYRSALATVDLEAQSFYGSSAIRKIYGNWIPALASQVAERLNDILLSRFKDPPRRFTFEVFRTEGGIAPQLGEGYRLQFWQIQNDLGEPDDIPIQIVKLVPLPDRFQIEAEELQFGNLAPVDLVNRVITIDSSYYNFNLKQVHDSIYPPLTDDDVSNGANITVIVAENVKVGSTSTSQPAFRVGTQGSDWPVGLPIHIENRGRIQGRGGDGGYFGAGKPGGTALHTRHPITLKNQNGQIWGGGGGGGSTIYEKSAWMGGGGAGNLPGVGGSGANPATQTSGGWHPWAGDGGGPGQNGTYQVGTVAFYSGGAAGRSIDGISFVTNDGPSGDRRGPTAN